MLGAAFGLAVIVGNTIGAGILRTPGEVAAHLPSLPWFLGVWLAGGLYALLGALNTAELGAMIPRSGGLYVFAHRALGAYPGFVVGWSDWISTCASLAAVTITLPDYLAPLFPGLPGHTAAGAVLVVAGLAALQWRGVREGDRFQRWTTLAKGIALGAVVLICALVPAARPAAPIPTGFVPGWTAVLLSLQAVIYTYDGWTGAFYFSGEMRSPGRDIPRATAAGVLSVLALYLALNLGFLHVLPLSRMAGDPFVAGSAVAQVLGARADLVLRVVMIVSLSSAANAILMMASRVPHAMAEDGLAHPRLSRVAPGGTPRLTLLGSTALAIGFLLTGAFNDALAAAAFYFVLIYVLAFSSVIVLRRREPAASRPYRAIGYPWTTLVVLLGGLGFLGASVAGDWIHSRWSLLLLLLSYPAFLLMRPRSGGIGT